MFSCISLTGTSLMIKYDEKCRNSQQRWCSNFLLTVQTEYMYCSVETLVTNDFLVNKDGRIVANGTTVQRRLSELHLTEHVN